MSRSSQVLVYVCLAAALTLPLGCHNDRKKPTTGSSGDPAMAPAAQLSLFSRLGGEPAMRAVVDDFVAIAAADPKVNFTRKRTPKEWQATPENVAKLKTRLVQFMSLVTGDRSASYEGGKMADVHKGMRITSSQFDASVQDLRQAMAKHNVSTDLQDELVSLVNAQVRPAIVEVMDTPAGR